MEIINLEAVRGDTNVYTGTATADGVAIDITGSTMRFTAKNDPSDADGSALISETTTGGGITLVTPASGVYRITLAPGDTTGLTVSSVLHYDVQLTTAGGAVYTLCKGHFTIVGDISVTQP